MSSAVAVVEPVGPAVGSHLDGLQAESITILREVAAEFERPALLFSGGKDSIVLLHLALKAFWPAPLPFPLLHVDTGHNLPEALAFRDRTVADLGLRLIVAHVQDSIDTGRVVDRSGQSRNPLQTVTLLDAINEHRFDALFGGRGAMRRRPAPRSGCSRFRDEFGQWDPKSQRPELWNLYHGRHRPGEHIRAFPISNWTELDLWSYISREGLAVPELYYAHQRTVVERDGMLLAVSAVTPVRDGETPRMRTVRYRTVGDMSCTGAIESAASDAEQVLAETGLSTVTERGATRADDRASEASMEDRTGRILLMTTVVS